MKINFGITAFRKSKITVMLIFIFPLMNCYSSFEQGLDQSSNLYHMHKRYYDPEVGAFISKDPSGYVNDINTYEYANSNPVNFIDPTGEAATLLIVAGVATYFFLNNHGVANAPDVGDVQISSSGAEGILMDAAFTGGASAGLHYGGKYLRAGAARIIPGGAGKISHEGVDYTLRYSQTTYRELFSKSPKALFSGQSIDSMAFKLKMGYPRANAPVKAILDQSRGIALIENTRTFQSYLRAGIEPFFIFNEPGAAGRVARHLSNNLLSNYGSAFAVSESLLPSLELSSALLLNEGVEMFLGNDPGGVLIDKAAELINGNLSDIKGVTFDPVSHQMIFMGTESDSSLEKMDMDYLYTAINAVYGSATPPFITLDPPARQVTECTMINKNQGSFTFEYNPLWKNLENDNISIIFNFIENDTTTYHAEAYLRAVYDGEYMKLQLESFTGAPTGMTCHLFGPLGGELQQQRSYYGVSFYYDGDQDVTAQSVALIPAKQHRMFGGRVENTRMGWVMFEADRVMKTLALGWDSLTTQEYTSDSSSMGGMVPGYSNLVERYVASEEDFNFVRLWLTPDDMNLERYVDEETGEATIRFSKSTVALNSEHTLFGGGEVIESQFITDFVDHFNEHYDEFADIEFTVYDPDDPTGTDTIQVKIFDMLKDVMQSVALARFFYENQIPLDMWWLNGWSPPAAHAPKCVPTIVQTQTNEVPPIMIYGGVTINKPNVYELSPLAESAGKQAVQSRPTINDQQWSVDVGTNTWQAVALSAEQDEQDGNITLVETDLSFVSPGGWPLSFIRYYNSSYLGKDVMGPGWGYNRYSMEFSRPTWFDKDNLMIDMGGDPIWKDDNYDTRLRSGEARVVDRKTGRILNFYSSLSIDYREDANGNLYIVTEGLNADGVADYSPGEYRDGSSLVQDNIDRSYAFTTPDGVVLEFDFEGRLLQHTDIHGYSYTYAYNTNGLLQTIEDSAVDEFGDPSPQSVSLFYDDSKLDYIELDFIGRGAAEVERVLYSYNATDCLARVTHERSGGYVEYSYNENLQITNKVFYNGLSAFNAAEMDNRGRTMQSIDLRGNTFDSAYTIDAQSLQHMTTITDAESSHQWQSIYDDQGRLLSFKDATEAQYFYGYDEGSWLPNSYQLPIEDRQAIEVQRNEYGFPTNVVDPDNIGALPQVVSYNAFNQPVRMTDELGRITELKYDPITHVLTNIVQYLKSETLVTEFSYENGRLFKVKDPLGHESLIYRDHLGRVTNTVDATQVDIAYEFDHLGRLWRVYDSLLDGEAIDYIEYVYDNFDRVVMVKTPDGDLEYVYDPDTGFLNQTIDHRVTPGRVYRYTYYETGDLKEMILETASGDVITSYTYDRFGKLASVDPPDAEPIVFETDDLGRSVGSTETDALTNGPPKALDSNNADNGVWTRFVDHLFTWGAPESDSGIAGYSYSLDAMPDEVVETSNATASVTGVSEGLHIFSVKAKSNSDIWGDPSTFDLLIDTTPPVIENIAMDPADVRATTEGAVTISADIYDALSGLNGSPQIRWCISSDETRPWSEYTEMTSQAGAEWSYNLNVDWTQYSGYFIFIQFKTEDIPFNIAESLIYSEYIDSLSVPFIINIR